MTKHNIPFPPRNEDGSANKDYAKIWRKINGDKYRGYAAKWRKNNPDKYKLSVKKSNEKSYAKRRGSIPKTCQVMCIKCLKIVNKEIAAIENWITGGMRFPKGSSLRSGSRGVCNECR